MWDPTHESAGVTRSLAILILIGLAVVICFQRWHTATEPVERDIAGYAVIGHEMLHGRGLYSDLWERKPPLLYGIFAAAESIAGYGPVQILLLNIASGLLTMVGLYFAGARVGSQNINRSAGLAAAGMFVIVGGDLYVQANQPNAEVFVNVCLTCAVAILLKSIRVDCECRTRSLQVGSALIVGTLFAAASLIKHHVVLIEATLAAAYLSATWKSSRYCGAKAICLIGSVVAITWCVVLAYFALAGRLHDFIDVLFHQNLDYAGNLWHSLIEFNRPFVLKGIFVRWTIGPLVLVLAAVGRIAFCSGFEWPRGGTVMLIAWAMGAWFAIALPGHFFPHYYQLAMPVLCLASAWAADVLFRDRSRLSLAIAYSTVAVAFGFSVIREARFYLLSPVEWTHRKNVGDFDVQTRMANRLMQMLQPGQTFWNFGDDVTLYFVTGLSPISGMMYLDPLEPGPYAAANWQKQMQLLQQHPPDLIVISRGEYWRVGLNTPVFPWMHADYLTVGVDPAFPRYLLMVRKNSALRRRLLPE